jgi:ferredoxin
LCARIAPEVIKLDAGGYPDLLDVAVPFWLAKEAGQAVDMCPALALTMTRPAERPPPVQPGQRLLPLVEHAGRGEPPTLSGRAVRRAELDESIDEASAWLSELGGHRRARSR